MVNLTKLLERFDNEPGYRQRVLDRVLVKIGESMDLFTDEGTLSDEDDERMVAARDPRVGGRPLHQYMGLPESAIRSMGVDDDGIDTLARHMEFAEEDDSATPPPAPPLTAPAVPSEIPETDEEGREHPDLQAWAAKQAQDREDLMASRAGTRNGQNGPVSIPQTPAPEDTGPADVTTVLPPPTVVPSGEDAEEDDTPPAPNPPAGPRPGPPPAEEDDTPAGSPTAAPARTPRQRGPTPK